MNMPKHIPAIFILFVFASGTSAFAQEPPKVIHVFVALCDNEYQSIAPVPPRLGNGDDPANNLYWGAMYGVKTFLSKSPNWKRVSAGQQPLFTPKSTFGKFLSLFWEPENPIAERCVFRHVRKNVWLVADAYKGREIRQAIKDFFHAASGSFKERASVKTDSKALALPIHGLSSLIVYVGHNGLADFRLPSYPDKEDDLSRDAMMFACKSKAYFRNPISQAGANPLLWTTGSMAPEAYILESVAEGWIAKESGENLRLRAAKAYHKYQKCGLNAAKRLFATGM